MPTMLFVDWSRWQPNPLNLDYVVAAGFSAVNVQLNGRDGYVSGPEARSRVESARAKRLAVSTYSWVDNLSSGAEQARAAFQRILAVGGPTAMAHMVDCEDEKRPATWPIWYDFVSALQDMLGRHVINYTGRWWWRPRWLTAQQAGKPDWTGSILTPYLAAAPNVGYGAIGHKYPGDDSEHWNAGYGGWAELSVLQYGVTPMAPYTVNFSKSAIRDRKIWFQLTGEEYPMHTEPKPPSPVPRVEFSRLNEIPVEDQAMDADRGDPERWAGAPKKDPWDEDEEA